MRGRKLRLSRKTATQGLRAASAAIAVLCASSCHEGIDTTRKAPPKATLGDDMYGVLCDRVGADSITDDLTGASYHAVCHYTDAGEYADKVDTAYLQPVSGEAAEKSRTLGVAKVETMARRRSELIRAFNAIFPDIEIDDVTTSASGDTVRLHDALMKFAQGISPLYETNPYVTGGEPLLPAQTRSLGRLFKAIVDSDEARAVMAKIAGRKGYRPSNVGLGAVRPALAYKDLRQLSSSALNVIGPGGPAEQQLQDLLRVTERELATAEVTVSTLPPYSLDVSTLQPNRPRSTIEFTRALMLSQDDAFAASPSDPERYIAVRDRRGFVMPLVDLANSGAPIAPFVDKDADGLADVDAFGRFIDVNGLPLAVDPPFAIPNVKSGPTDAFGRPETPLYQYVDTSRTMIAALTRTLIPLLDATQYAPQGDPEAWKSEHETLMYALAGAYVLYGDRENAQYDYVNSRIVPAGEPCDGCLQYRRFRGEDSPLPDLIHAAGQLLADKDSDGILLGLIDLIENHEDAVARLLGAALKVREIALAHDALARQGQEPFAVLPYETPIWDEVAGIMGRITQRPGLTRKLVEAFGEDTLKSPIGGAAHVGDTLSKFVTFRDELTYNPTDINGPTINLTVGGNTSDPMTPVDLKLPKQGKNRSCLQRSLQMIHDANNTKACNKNDAVLHLVVFGADFDYPLFGGTFNECELFSFDNLAAFYLDAILDANHPKRAELKLNSGFLDWAVGVAGSSADDIFLESSLIEGLTVHPTPPALNRLVFFGAGSQLYPNMPDYDFLNEGGKTSIFVSDLIEPVSGSVCPKKPNGVRKCDDKKDVLRIRDANSIFLWERFGFYEYLKPLVTVFANESCSADLSSCNVDDVSGEQIFVDLVDVLNRHWSGKDHGDECNSTGDPTTNSRYCSEAGVSSYEPIMGEAFAGDLIPALVDFSKIAREISAITVQRGPDKGQVWSGAEVLERTAKILFNPDYAASVGMKDRQGKTTALWVDGKTETPVTGFTIFTDALHKMDTRFDSACSCNGKEGQELVDCNASYDACRLDAEDRKGQWKRARSQLVDAFLSVEGDGLASKFKNPAAPKFLLATLKTLREQINANCPNRENGPDYECDWARKDLSKKLSDTLSGPLFATLMDLQESLRSHEASRRELEKFLSYILADTSDNDALQATLASASDILQVVADDADLAPLLQAVAGAARPGDDPAGPGAADTGVKVLKAMASDDFDKYHVLDYVLPGLVTPMDDGKGLSPIEVIMDVVADVNRIDAASQDPLIAEDYKAVMDTVRDFMENKTRGLEQIYSIVQNRTRE